MVISLDEKIRNMDGEMKENETLREQIRSLEEANKAQGQEREELEKRIKKLEGEKSQLESRISKQEDKNKQLNDNLKELDEGDTITLTQRIDDNWYEGTLNGKTGMFPVSYVNVTVPLP
ncbi:Endophilin-A3 [Halocaridina rubra]|uniref:Endophilin-A3 n=1 Tax=Halocaridina rubra TaxID=373956 RepID=A0AAN8XP02_HALRR